MPARDRYAIGAVDGHVCGVGLRVDRDIGRVLAGNDPPGAGSTATPMGVVPTVFVVISRMAAPSPAVVAKASEAVAAGTVKTASAACLIVVMAWSSSGVLAG